MSYQIASKLIAFETITIINFRSL